MTQPAYFPGQYSQCVSEQVGPAVISCHWHALTFCKAEPLRVGN